MNPTSVAESIPVGPMVPLPMPDELERLADLAYNLWWSWNPDAAQIWSALDAKKWATGQNPITLLQQVERDQWEALVTSGSFLDRYHDVLHRFDNHMSGAGSWYATEHGDDLKGPIAYLCAEYGIEAKLRLYSGGLGILAGDHLKAASDLGVPLVALGLFYRRGYFQQAVDPEGNQEHTYVPIDPARRPFRRVLDRRTGLPLVVEIDFPGRTVSVAAWRLDVGRVPVILLDTDLAANDPADRPITHALYVRGREMRFCQELVLGVGSARVLAALGIEPATWHVNEGHAALSLLERLAATGGPGEEHERRVRDKTLFTLHTPVPAGNEIFALDMVGHYLKAALPSIPFERAAALAAANDGSNGRFDLGALAVRMTAKTNGVSRRHTEVVNQDWGHVIGGDATGVTNGVHPQTWVGGALVRIFREMFGDEWERRVADPEAWVAIHDVPDARLWQAHHAQKRSMLRVVRTRIRDQYARHGMSPDDLRAVDDLLPDHRLTIVFARRFATYKRSNLLFTDQRRLRALLTDPDREVQVIFAGKAHPADREGQSLIRRVVEMSHSPGLESHVFFLENYDLTLGAALVQGADIWLNNPRPPKEASGTSGMKAASNGGVNVSVLDGWWLEGYNGKNGWGFGEHSTSDVDDAATLYGVLENEAVPMFYDRAEDGMPHQWIGMMKESISSVLPNFSAQRMVREYTERAYLPLGSR